MISAFGVEHIAKSYVSGKGWVKATDLTPGMKNLIRTRARNKGRGAGGSATPGRKVEGQSAKGRTVYDRETRSMQRRISTDVLDSGDSRLKSLGYQVLGHSQPNGRGGGILRMNPRGANQEATYRHELAHLKPKRNPVRLSERTADSRRLGREEGRADFIGNRGKRTPGSYPGNKQFQRGYNEVQNRMHLNRKPRKFEVDSKGTTVQKSAFGVLHKALKLGKPVSAGIETTDRLNSAQKVKTGQVLPKKGRLRKL
jgi:hypothetical protein